ncbi:hypothetical protein BDV96DRAFT_644325 [Lophiotrema nucula]|uniref:Nucleotidylyl transferase n=1 Tax=Lophiotrema nucula TaxID=690887 RepID=A0A6A5ZET4_9PLEO|nr:hypothetical protein BDV96DRAFT_644325 [Lophiotrema nucula]
MVEMSHRIATLRTLLPELEQALHSFTSSSAKFRIVRTVHPASASRAAKTLYILDSSFNPPSIAHLALAKSALTNPAPADETPFRLLLLFSTHNADKAPSPASFVQRLALMTVFAEDVVQQLSLHPTDSEASNNEQDGGITVDIGLTKEPYYTDKSIAITELQPAPYPSRPRHVHLVGYDTLIRFCNPKYYKEYEPPLSALRPFFEPGHKLRVTQRPFNPSDSSSSEFGSIEEQEAYVKHLREGRMEDVGFEKAWADGGIDMVQADEGVGVSSTRVRKAAKERDWDTVGKLCTEGVAAWIRDQELYSEDATGKKMMG